MCHFLIEKKSSVGLSCASRYGEALAEGQAILLDSLRKYGVDIVIVIFVET